KTYCSAGWRVSRSRKVSSALSRLSVNARHKAVGDRRPLLRSSLRAEVGCGSARAGDALPGRDVWDVGYLRAPLLNKTVPRIALLWPFDRRLTSDNDTDPRIEAFLVLPSMIRGRWGF